MLSIAGRALNMLACMKGNIRICYEPLSLIVVTVSWFAGNRDWKLHQTCGCYILIQILIDALITVAASTTCDGGALRKTWVLVSHKLC